MVLSNPDVVDNVPQGKYPAKAHAKRVAEYIFEHGGGDKGVIYLEAQKSKVVEVSLSTDVLYHFQENS